MTFLHPLALLALLAVPAAVLLLAWAAARRREALIAFAAADQMDLAQVAARRRRWQGACFVGALALMGLALAGPRYGTELRDIRQDGVDLIVALDVSNSMYAEDVAPSRLERARFEIERLLGDLAGSRVGIVLFAGEAFLLSPLTTDFSAVRLYLGTASPELIPTQGTDFAEALRVATHAFQVAAGGDEPRARVLLFVSDGEDHLDRYGPPLREAEAAGITLFSVGIGEPAGAEVPRYRDGRRVGVHTDRQGNPVISRLDDGALRRIGQSGGYVHIGRDRGDLSDLTAALARLDRGALASDQYAAYAERYQWPLGLALLLLVAGSLLAAWRPARRRVPA